MMPALSGRGEGFLARGDLAGSAQLELVSGVAHLHREDAMFEAMLRGFRAQQVARGLRSETVEGREALVRRFAETTNEYPWNWGPAHVEEWTLTLCSERHLAPSTIRGYQVDLRLFSEYVCDPRYGWGAACEDSFGTGVHPVPICHEWNTIAHLSGYEGSPEARPFTREEIQRFLDYADDQVERAAASKRKGTLTAYRDATIFKVMYGWGLRRTETTKLDLADWGRNPAAPGFGDYGTLAVRYGKAKRGGPPRRRNVASVMGWAVDGPGPYNTTFSYGDGSSTVINNTTITSHGYSHTFYSCTGQTYTQTLRVGFGGGTSASATVKTFVGKGRLCNVTTPGSTVVEKG
jgi:integrase/recombinase XerC